MRFRKESAQTYRPKHTPVGSSFWPYGVSQMKHIKIKIHRAAADARGTDIRVFLKCRFNQ